MAPGSNRDFEHAERAGRSTLGNIGRGGIPGRWQRSVLPRRDELLSAVLTGREGISNPNTMDGVKGAVSLIGSVHPSIRRSALCSWFGACTGRLRCGAWREHGESGRCGLASARARLRPIGA